MSRLFLIKGSFPDEYFKLTADYITSVQQPDGSIPWFEGGYTDPWDHVESAMGLSICGKYPEAENAYKWMKETQRDDGGWWNAYKDGTIEDDSRTESNFVAYLATGVWHHYLVTGRRNFLRQMWSTVEAAIEYVLNLQTDYGEICWAVDSQVGVREDALITGCSSIYKSLECAINIAAILEKKRDNWTLARNKLGHTIRNHPERFDRTWESKSRYSMDWFYPVLTGVVTGPAARSRINSKWDTFVVDQLGCLCVSDEPWVTIAESCELTMSLIAAGDRKKAAQIFSWLHNFRLKDGSYWTGYVYEKKELWPEEKPTWTAGAVLLAADALANATQASQLFTKVSIPVVSEDKKNIHYA